jgi:hypothetical protein
MDANQLFQLIKMDILDLIMGGRGINADAFVNPEKYLIKLPIEKVVADSKVTREGVEWYKQKIASGEKIKPVLVVKHPRKQLYAVLDGHHRYYAFLEMKEKEVDCAITGNYSRVIFYLTKNGYFQPSKEVTKNVRTRILELHEGLKQFLSEFAKN